MTTTVTRGLVLASFVLLQALPVCAQESKPDPRRVKEQVQAALAKLTDANKAQREPGAVALWELGAAAKDAAPALTKALEDTSPRVRLYSAAALLRIDQTTSTKALPVLIAILKDPKSEAIEALVVCKNLRPAREDLVLGLLDMLRDAHPLVMAAARMALENVGPTAADAAPVLKLALTDKNTEVRFTAAAALLRIDPMWKKEVQPVLEKVLRGGDYSLRVEAAKLLLKMGPGLAPKVSVALASGLESKDFADRMVVAELLVEVAPEKAPAVAAALAEGLKDGDAEKRRSYVEKLAALGRYGRGAETELRAAVDDTDAAVAVAAAEALLRIVPQKGRDLLPVLAAQRDKRDKTEIAKVLELIEQLHKIMDTEIAANAESRRELEKDRLQRLTEQLSKPAPRTNGDLLQLYAALRLAQLGPRAKDAVPALIEALEGEGLLRGPVLFALGKVGPDARRAVPALLKIYRGRDNFSIGLRREAAEALLAIDPKIAKAEGVR